MTQADELVRFCSRIGGDPLLVQGAGGNVSRKEGDTLWIKGSGTWLAHAVDEEIFVPVDLAHLRRALARGECGAAPRVLGESTLRPSIETALHALMPHRVVAHLHPVQIVSRLVRSGCRSELEALLPGTLRWAMVEYHKPGPALAAAVLRALADDPEVPVIFLKNHGIVLGGSGPDEVASLLEQVLSYLPAPAGRAATAPAVEVAPLAAPHAANYHPVAPQLQQLAFPPYFDLLQQSWALYPDHVVFLGAEPRCYHSPAQLADDVACGAAPEFFFLAGLGVFAVADFAVAKRVQLQCFHDVLARQPEGAVLTALSAEEVAELLDWDAERYRQQLAATAPRPREEG